MVRFARSEGSKGSNKRVLEDATPWSAMVADMKKKKRADVVEEVISENVDDETKKNNFLSRFKITHEKAGNTKKDSEDTTVKKDVPVAECNTKKRKKKVCKDSGQVAESVEVSALKEGSNDDAAEDSKVSRPKKKKQVNKDNRMVIENGQKYFVSEGGFKREWFDLPYEESDKMTRYEGFWVKTESAKKLKLLQKELSETMDANMVRKKMMKAKRKAHTELTRELIDDQKKEPKMSGEENIQKCKKKNIEKADDSQIKFPPKSSSDEKVERVLFDGYWVTKEGSVRLTQLRADLLKKGVSKVELRLIIKKERRKEERVLKNDVKRVCLRCRRRGHMISECPEITGEYGAQQNFVCYGCGSTEHRVNNCPKVSKGDEFPLATCFVCRKVGHISRQCPDNPRGLYPNGGSCRGCGSVVHLAANCPVIQTQHENEYIKVGRIDGNSLETLDYQEPQVPLAREPTDYKKMKPKIILFD